MRRLGSTSTKSLELLLPEKLEWEWLQSDCGSSMSFLMEPTWWSFSLILPLLYITKASSEELETEFSSSTSEMSRPSLSDSTEMLFLVRVCLILAEISCRSEIFLPLFCPFDFFYSLGLYDFWSLEVSVCLDFTEFILNLSKVMVLDTLESFLFWPLEPEEGLDSPNLLLKESFFALAEAYKFMLACFRNIDPRLLLLNFLGLFLPLKARFYLLRARFSFL